MLPLCYTHSLLTIQYVSIICLLLVWHMTCLPAGRTHRRTDTGTEGRWSIHSAKIKDKKKKKIQVKKVMSHWQVQVKQFQESCLWRNCALWDHWVGRKNLACQKGKKKKTVGRGTACCGSRPHRSSRPWIQENVAQGIHKPSNLSETLKKSGSL